MRNRPRRLRQNNIIRDLVRETSLSINDLIYPVFVCEGEKVKQEIESMPEIYRYSLDMLSSELDEVKKIGIKSILLFGIPNEKDEVGSGAYDENGIVQKAVRYIKQNYDFLVVTDVCLCEYTSHGHCGVVENGEVLNDETLPLLAKTALSHAQAGADIVAPSDMMDGRVLAIRECLDESGFKNTPIMAYSAKYCSAYYGPFRDAADSAPKFGDRKSYQMDSGNAREAVKEMALDIQEGADMIMVKPALAYLDIIKSARENFDIPVVAYNVSGEYAMVKAAAKMGWIDEMAVIKETLLSMKRAGADIIITYHAKEIARELLK
ncbi:MAG: porphobilinogen synthase [Oscillospiraceae bacterium]|jgi:porphobilinogen synthase|nr:porphobilinogen synthase [Oscillospiraceae bacterium]